MLTIVENILQFLNDVDLIGATSAINNIQLPYVFYEVDGIQIVYKPSGFSVDEVVKIIQESVIGWSYIHRLDKATSGVLIGSAQRSCRRRLTNHLKKRKCRKIYFALVEGEILEENFRVDHTLHHSKRGQQSACTEFFRVSVQSARTLLLVIPLTGRWRQIRKHLFLHGTPIVGDAEFGNTDEIPSICLHAARYIFPQFPLDVTAPCPKWLSEFPIAMQYLENFAFPEFEFQEMMKSYGKYVDSQ